MRRITVLLVLSLLALLLVVACGDDVSTTTPEGVDKGLGNPGGDPIYEPLLEPWQQQYYDSLDYEYQFIQGEVNVSTGGTLQGDLMLPNGQMATLTLNVPVGAVAWPGAKPWRDFRIGVPVNNGNNPALILRLEPDMEFDVPVTVTVAEPNSMAENDLYKVYCVYEKNGQVHYSDWQSMSVTNGQVSFTTSHFSRWPLGTAKSDENP